MASYAEISQALPGTAYIYANPTQSEIYSTTGSHKVAEIEGERYLGTTQAIIGLEGKLLSPTEDDLAEIRVIVNGQPDVLTETLADLQELAVETKVEDASEQAG